MPMHVLTYKGTAVSFLGVMRDALLLELKRAADNELASKTSTMYTELSCHEHQQKIKVDIDDRAAKMEQMLQESTRSVGKARTQAMQDARRRRIRKRNDPPLGDGNN